MKFVVLYSCFALILVGCDIFQTRSSEAPISARSTFEFPSSPQIVIQNLVNSLKEKNAQNYLLCFSDGSSSEYPFRFIPSGSVANPQIFDSEWNVLSEERYFRSLVSKLAPDDPILLYLSDELSEKFGADSTIYTANYSLILPQKANISINHFQGIVKFTMNINTRTAGVYISRWIDIKNSADPCWSDLKGIYY